MKQWYKVEYTVKNHVPEGEIPGYGKVPEHWDWYIATEYFEGVRKANKFMKEHASDSPSMTIIYR